MIENNVAGTEMKQIAMAEKVVVRGVLDRRSWLAGASAVALAGFWTSRSAEAAPVSGQAEWRQNYDAGATRSLSYRASAPMLSQESVIATEQAIQQYRQIASAGGWRPLAASGQLRLGARGPAVLALRQRLAITGDIDQSSGASNTFDRSEERSCRERVCSTV